MTDRPPADEAGGAGGAGDPAVEIDDVGMSFKKDPKSRDDWVLRHVGVTVRRGEFFVIVGPSGCGKSTLLRMIAGIQHPTEGIVRADGAKIDRPGPDRGMVFQSVETPLFDWLTVRGNVAFGLTVQGMRGSQRADLVSHYLNLVGLQEHARKYPPELSGGMKQRVQIARVLAARPHVVLLDEPFAALDAQTRRILQTEISRIWTEEKRTFVYVTHDITEAVLLGQRIAVMSAPPESNFLSTYEIDLPYPRDPFAERYIRYARSIQADIESEVEKVWRRGGSAA